MSQPTKTPAEELKAQTIGFVIAAFGFVAGLAWNDAVKALIDALVPVGSDGIAAKFAYAGIVTVILAAASWLLLRKKK
jgi:C4-dicarboxylate transporter